MPEHDHEGAATYWIAGSRDAYEESRFNIKAQGVILGLFLFVGVTKPVKVLHSRRCHSKQRSLKPLMAEAPELGSTMCY